MSYMAVIEASFEVQYFPPAVSYFWLIFDSYEMTAYSRLNPPQAPST